MSIARHHNEWLSLIEVSGPFLSMPVLLRVFPQGLDALDRAGLSELRLAYEEWLDDQNSLRPSPAIHSTWVRYVFEHVLGFDKSCLLEGPAIPANLKTFVAEHGETLRPDLVIASSDPSDSKPRLLVQVCPIQQGLEKTMQDRRWKASPAMRMMELLRATGVQLGLVTNGEQWMLVNAPRGETSTFISWYAALWLEEPLTLRAFKSLLGAARFFSVSDVDTLEGMLKDSVNEQQEVTDQLGYQVRRAVEVLIRAVDKADQDRGRVLLKEIREADLYEAALIVMMRLVFIFSAEERGLLLLGDPLYDQNYAISTLRAQLRETADHQGEEVLERRFDSWCRLLAAFRAVHGGIHHDRLNLPAYGGSLFNPERFPFLEGRTSDQSIGSVSEPLPISNRTVLHLLEALQVLRVKVPGGGPAEARRLSFRALDVEQIGHVYEGLLDHVAVRAREPVLGLVGTREKEPEIPLSVLLAEEAKGEKGFLAFLNEQTGRSENALRKALQEKAEIFASQHLQIACNNDPQVTDQVLKYASMIREDDFGYPVVFLTGSVYVTAGATRRATGTHYTPRSLTEPIVQHTLEPLVYTGPAEGLSREDWKLKSPAELLELKICDMAMGSAGFLVQVIRYLSERLVETWDGVIAEKSPAGNPILTIQITPEGQLATGKPGELIIPKDDEERLIFARRLVADRCIYGVDKNPLAVEIAKLSIWLTTMDKGRPFTFLDHALKCGDSLVGTDEEMFRQWAYSLKGAQFTLYLTTLDNLVQTARDKRKKLESFPVVDARDVEQKTLLLKEADEDMARIKLGCDLLVGVRLLGLKADEQEEILSHLLWDYIAGLPMNKLDAQQTLHAARKERAFHWQFEFPEVFDKGGFSAFVGNPPFLGGKRISTEYGMNYQIYLKNQQTDIKGAADICAYFFLHGFLYLRKSGILGLIATNSISQGDTREVGLDYILNEEGTIFIAEININWPGTAAVVVDVIHICKGKFQGICYINGNIVDFISSLLDTNANKGNPFRLKENTNLSFIGTFVNGIGFVIDADEARKLIESNPDNMDVLYPYLIGQDFNTNFDQSPNRWIINFFDWSFEKVSHYPECLQLLQERVKPARDEIVAKGKQVHEYDYWKYWDKRPNLYKTIAPLYRVLVIALTSSTVAFDFSPTNIVFSHAVGVIADDTYSSFSILQSSIHMSWAWRYGSSLKGDLRYTPSDIFETYPFPKRKKHLEEIGKNYHSHRRIIMSNSHEGLTKTYNRFHDPKEKGVDINRLRDLHIEIDKAVAEAYGWNDLDLGHGFHETAQGVRFTISEAARREVLARLLRLNHERHEEEVRQGLHDKKKVKPTKEKKGKSIREEPGQYELF